MIRANNLVVLSGPIPVRISDRPDHDEGNSRFAVSTPHRARTLTKCKTETKCRSIRSRFSKAPSLMLSNVRSLCNKIDELESRMSQLKPDVAVLTESWLDENVPDSSISINDYSIARKDRNRFGGGLIIYVSSLLQFQMLDVNSVQEIDACESEILTLMFPVIKLILIAIYHPFWNDSDRNNKAVSTIADIMEYVFSLPKFDPSSTNIQ